MVNLDYEHTTDVTRDVLSGKSIRGASGFNEASRKRSAIQHIRLSEAFQLWDKFQEGQIDPYLMRQAFNPTQEFAFKELQRYAPHVFHEAMTLSDFSLLTSQILDRTLLENYKTLPSTYDQIAQVRTDIRDFRSVLIGQIDGMEGVFQAVKEMEGFERHAPTQSTYSYAVSKYEGGYGISWEAVINDDLGIFNDLPKRLALGAKRSVEQFVTKLYCDANGPHASMYTAGNANKIIVSGTTNPTLTITNLIGALGQFMNLKTADGRPIAVGGVKLVVGDGVMYNTAKNIEEAMFGDFTVMGGQQGTNTYKNDTVLRVRNWVAGKFTTIFNPEIANIATANGPTSWWLFAEPSIGRPAMQVGFLRGFDTPALFRKVSNTVRVGGGVDESMGDFESMSTEFKGLIVFGGTRLDPKATMASNGTGS